MCVTQMNKEQVPGPATLALENEMNFKRRRVEVPLSESDEDDVSPAFCFGELFKQVTEDDFPSIGWDFDGDDDNEIITLPTTPSNKRSRDGLFRSKSFKTGLADLAGEDTENASITQPSMVPTKIEIEHSAEDLLALLKPAKSLSYSRSHLPLAPLSRKHETEVVGSNRSFALY